MSEAHDPPAHPKKKSSAALRTLILLGLLLLIVAGGLWDWYGAKQPRDEAYDRVLAVQASPGGMASASQPATTQADVQKAVGTQPSETTTEDGVIYERYSWRRGIPWMTYDLWVLYRGDEGKEMLVAQLGEEGKPDTIYAANSRGGEAPMPDPSTVRPIVDGESPYPPPRVEEPAEDDAAATPAEGDAPAEEVVGEPAEGDAPAAGADQEPAELGDAPAETPAETPEGDAAEGSADAAPDTELSEDDASPSEPATEETEPESP